MKNDAEDEKKARWISAIKISGSMMFAIIVGLIIVIYVSALASENSFWYEFVLLREKLGILGKYPIITILLVFIISLLLIYRETEHVDSNDEQF
ncbi:hypothetical protein SDC9_07803 [bioreactor metagenome]|uniref:Uncharacterized protein n=1 Tax=bioreactor metagenome TaxID=1076179 RepID=A0A644T5J2_9ZZZZ|nr:hypothetical protein [Candidatus Elulimicrobiales bacterium]